VIRVTLAAGVQIRPLRPPLALAPKRADA
jgi:hypothetical protein